MVFCINKLNISYMKVLLGIEQYVRLSKKEPNIAV